MLSNHSHFLRAVCLAAIPLSVLFAQTSREKGISSESRQIVGKTSAPRTLSGLMRERLHQKRARPAGLPAFTPQSVLSFYISTVAGNGIEDYTGDGGPATNASESFPVGVAVDHFGNFYVVELGNNCVRKISASGIITTVAGNGIAGYSGDGGQAINAELNSPTGVAVDSAGNIYIADGDNQRIRKVATNGIITTVAGNGIAGYSGDGGPATSARLDTPESVRIDAYGNLFWAEPGNDVIRKMSTAGVISTVAGTGEQGTWGDNGPATSAALWSPNGVAVDGYGNIYIADTGNWGIRKVGTDGIIRNVCGDYYTKGYSGDGGPASNAILNDPFSVDVDAAGNIFIADTDNYRIRAVTPDGMINTVAGNGYWGFSGDGGPATSAEIDTPLGVTADSTGKVYIADSLNDRVRLLGPHGVASASLTITKSHLGNFVPGQSNATYTIVVSNSPGAGSTSGTVTVSDSLPYGLTLASMTGSGWSCYSTTCSRSDALSSGASYPAIAVMVNVSSSASGTVINQATVSGGGSAGASASDPTAISGSGPPPTLIGGTLPDGLAGSSYSTSLTSKVSGGTAPYTWTQAGGNLPGGVSVTAAGLVSGVPASAGTFSFTARVSDAYGQSATAGFQLTINAGPAGVPTRAGVFGHIAAGAGWKSTFTVENNDTIPIHVRVVLYGETGALLALPLTFPQAGGGAAVTASSVDRNIPVHGSLVIDTEGLNTTVTGWADVLSTGRVGGAVIFRLRVNGRPDQEGTAALDTHSQGTLVVPFDATGGYIPALAICSIMPVQTGLTVTVYDENGVLISQRAGDALPAYGHTSFAVTDRVPEAAGRRGEVVFSSNAGSPIVALGLRFTPTASFTSVPVVYP